MTEWEAPGSQKAAKLWQITRGLECGPASPAVNALSAARADYWNERDAFLDKANQAVDLLY